MKMKIIKIPSKCCAREIEDIESMVRDANCLFTTFSFLKDEQYEISTYQMNKDIKFQVLLDRNYVSELLKIFSIATSETSFTLTKGQKNICAQQAFLQISNITSEPNISCYEYLDNHNYDAFNKELSEFRAADNLPAKIYVDLAIGKYPKIPLKFKAVVSKEELTKKEIERKLVDFEANFLIVKKAISLVKQGIKNGPVMLRLIDWMYEEYLFTTPAVFFLNYYLSPNKPGLRKMIKSYDSKGLRNATWDLTLLQSFVEKIENETKHNKLERWLLCSNDKAIKKIIPFLFASHEEDTAVSNDRLRKMFVDSWGKNTGVGKTIFEKLISYQNSLDGNNRKCNQDNFRGHIDEIRVQLDKELNTAD